MKFGNMTQGLNTSSLLPCKYYSFTRIDSIAEKLSELILFFCNNKQDDVGICSFVDNNFMKAQQYSHSDKV